MESAGGGVALGGEGVQGGCERKTLGIKVWHFVHPRHGSLEIKREAKFPDNKRILFRLELTPPGGGTPIREVCGLCVSDADSTAIPDPGWHKMGYMGVGPSSSVGYGDIDLGHLTGKGIIYLLHHVFALTGQELGVALVVVESIVNPDRMNPACEKSGISDPAKYMNSYQGPCDRVVAEALEHAKGKGWLG